MNRWIAKYVRPARWATRHLVEAIQLYSASPRQLPPVTAEASALLADALIALTGAEAAKVR